MRAAQRVAAACLIAALAGSCSTENVLGLRPDVDVGTSTAAVTPAYAPQSTPYEPDVGSAAPDFPPDYGDATQSFPDDTVDDADASPAGPTTTHMDPIEPAPTQVAALPPVEMPETAPTETAPVEVAYPRLDDPSEIEPVEPPAVMSSAEAACRRDLKRLGVRFQDIEPIHESARCGIDWPVKVYSIGSVKMKPAATLSCQMAATFASWTKKELVPAARWRYMSGVKTIHQGSSYSCRNIRGSRGTPSQHSIGNALDVMRIELNNGKDIDVRKPGWFAFRQKAFLNTVRKDGCDYFNTVLGPGYNADHADHFHFDIMPRRNVACR
jgi:hypothetical protein